MIISVIMVHNIHTYHIDQRNFDMNSWKFIWWWVATTWIWIFYSLVLVLADEYNIVYDVLQKLIVIP